MASEKVVKCIIDNGIVAVDRTKLPDKFIRIVEAIYEGGIKSTEITTTLTV